MEQWRPVLGSDSYLISDHGQVWSIKRQSMAKLTETSTGYQQVFVGRTRPVHHLVLEAFVQPRPSPEAETRHLDGDPANNRPENLAWGDRLENAADKRAHRTHNMTQRQTCRRRGHDLVEVNLDPYDAARGVRKCWSCHWAFLQVIKQRKWDRHFDRDVLADMLYAHLMEGAADPRGSWRKWGPAQRNEPVEAAVTGGRLRSSTPSAEQALLACAQAGEVFSPEQLRQRLAGDGERIHHSTAQVALARAARAGRLVKVARGRYRLPASAAETAIEAS